MLAHQHLYYLIYGQQQQRPLLHRDFSQAIHGRQVLFNSSLQLYKHHFASQPAGAGHISVDWAERKMLFPRLSFKVAKTAAISRSFSFHLILSWLRFHFQFVDFTSAQP